MSYLHFIGIDVSKNHIDVALHGAKAAKPQRFQNGDGGFAAFAGHFAEQLLEAFVVVEATGGYESALVAFLLSKQIAVHRADPLTAKCFIRSCRLRGKTDALDAQGLARYAAERHEGLRRMEPVDEAQAELELLLARRADLVASRVAERNRADHPRYASLKTMLQEMIQLIDEHIRHIEELIETAIAASRMLKAKRDTLLTVKGIGRTTANQLLAAMPELGHINRRQAASLAGCAPHPRQSGQNNAYAKTGGGRMAVKQALFMAALSASRYHPELNAFYHRLIQNGKKKIVAITAVMRKLITISNAKIRDNILSTQ